MTETTLTPARLWKKMTSEQKLKAAQAFWADEEGTDDQVQAALLIAQTKKFRAKTVLSLDDERKAKHLASLPTLPETIAARALVVYHLAEQRPMMGAFLDALGIAHENGVIQEDDARDEGLHLQVVAAHLGLEDVDQRGRDAFRRPERLVRGVLGTQENGEADDARQNC